MKNKSKMISSLLTGTCIFTLVACGSDNEKAGGTSETQLQQQLGDQGIYRAVLRPLNPAVAGNSSGTVEIRIEGDDVIAETNVADAPSGVKHLQNIMFATACPTADADINNDTFVDIAEAMPSTGPILIPLDSDLSEQLDGMSYGPIANGSGSFVYRRSTALTDLLADLHAPDPDVADAIFKLPAGQDLNLAGRVVIVHGVATSRSLPETVATTGDFSSEQTLPIACGQLVRITSEEGASETDSETESDTEIGMEDGSGTVTGGITEGTPPQPSAS